MTAKRLLFGDDARERMRRGIDTLAEAVKVTLGPRGRTVILDREYGPPQIVNSGVLVAKSVELEDRFENMGAQMLREVAARTTLKAVHLDAELRKIEADLGDTLFAVQLLCLRLAVILCHARRDPDLHGLTLGLDGSRFSLRARTGWAASYPQSAYLLREEIEAWQRTGWELDVQLP